MTLCVDSAPTTYRLMHKMVPRLEATIDTLTQTLRFEPSVSQSATSIRMIENAYCSVPSRREIRTNFVLNTSLTRCAIRSKLMSGAVFQILNLHSVPSQQ